MLDIGGFELLLIAAVLILVVGPKDLPRVLRAGGRFMAKMRGMTRDFQRTIDDMAREADVADMRKELKSVSDAVSGSMSESEITKKVENTIDPSGDLRDAMKEDYGSTGGSTGESTEDAADKASVKLPPLAPGPDSETPETEAASPKAEPGEAEPGDDVDEGEPAPVTPELTAQEPVAPAVPEEKRVQAGGAAEA